MPYQTGIEPDELTVAVIGAIRSFDHATCLARRIAKAQTHQPACSIQNGAVQISSALAQRYLTIVLAIGKLAGIAGIESQIVERHAFQHIAN